MNDQPPAAADLCRVPTDEDPGRLRWTTLVQQEYAVLAPREVAGNGEPSPLT
jgi:hypothetical protein